jgi:disulfide oxidoreductase YuzD
MVDGVSYLDTEYLEQHEFNVEGKKRFYALPDGLGGTQIVEREKGVNLSALRVEKPKQPLVVLAPNYQRLDATTLQDLAGVTCFEPKQLQKLNELHDVAVDIWPRPNFEQNFAFVAVKLHEQVQQIHLMSYATTTKRPQYYWPLVMFLNEQGCVTEGVNQFLQTRVKATMLQQAALQGYLRVPEGSKYIVLTPLAETAELSDLTLSDRGQLRLTPVDLTSPP